MRNTCNYRSRAAMALLCCVAGGSVQAQVARDPAYDARAREYLASLVYTPEAVARWLQGHAAHGESYHGVLGWVHNPRKIQHGIDRSYAIYEYDSDGARRRITYPAEPCRIHTYGNSFTSCEQVNDGETWQEMLAAHLCEPIRNFGIGGYSVYQSYRRMLLEEPRTPARYIIFNIYDDDHYRNLTGWRNIRLGLTAEMRPDVSSPTLPYIKANPAEGTFVEIDNLCPTPESIYNLCDADWVFATFKDNFVLKLRVAKRDIEAGQAEKSYGTISALAREHGSSLDIGSPRSLEQAINEVFTRTAIYATMRIVEKVEAYAKAQRKKVLYVLSYSDHTLMETVRSGKRFDQALVDYLNKENLPYVDLLEAHLSDFSRYKISVEAYARQFWIGHYNPRGNFFQAYALKGKVVDMLDPKPAPYNSDPVKDPKQR